MEHNIFLIGFMGTGKSAVSGALSRKYGMEVLEMDQILVEEAGMPISEIFAKYGEEHFRNMETDLLVRCQGQSNKIVSCGGGAAMRTVNVAEMKKSGVIVLLTAKPETIFERVKDDHNRPLLENNKTVEYIAELIEKRRPKYEAAADFSVTTDYRSPNAIAEEIMKKAEAFYETKKQPAISGHTGLLCLLGSPVAHSVSPAMHNEACRRLGLDYRYLAFAVPEESMPQAVEGLRTMGARGWNITMPGKHIMCRLADRVSPASRISGSCNTIVNDRGVLTAYTTDGIGFMRALKDYGVEVKGKKMTMLGAGGAASSALAQAALDGVSEIDVYNRTVPFARQEEMLEELAELTSCKVTVRSITDTEALRRSIAESTVLVNCTSVGMAPNIDRTILPDVTMFHKELFVFDMIYNPRETRFLREAREQGCRTGNGMYMLLYQGAASFALWTGQEMPVEAIKELYFRQ